MRLVFLGASRFGLRCLRAAAELRAFELSGIVTAPAVFRISYRPEGVRNVLHADFEPLASELGAPLRSMERGMNDDELVRTLSAWAPELILAVGWYHLVPAAVRALCPVVGLHASLLPKYAGGAPLVWAMINGESRTGITLFRFEEGVDTGPIIGQRSEPILEADTIATLYSRIEEHGLALLREHLPKIADGTAEYRPQDLSLRTQFPQRGPEDGRIDWSWDAARVHDFVRAQTRPYPGAFGAVDGAMWRIWSGRPGSAPGPSVAGDAIALDGVTAVACGDGRVYSILEAERID